MFLFMSIVWLSMAIAANTKVALVSLYPMGARFWGTFLLFRRCVGIYPIVVLYTGYDMIWSSLYIIDLFIQYTCCFLRCLGCDANTCMHRKAIWYCAYTYTFTCARSCVRVVVFLCMADRFVVALSSWTGHRCILVRVWFRLAVGISRSVRLLFWCECR